MGQILAYADKTGKVVKSQAILATADADGRVTPSTSSDRARSRVSLPSGVVGSVLAYADVAGHVFVGQDLAHDHREATTPQSNSILRPLYVSRQVENADELIAWAKSVGFTTTLSVDDMHVTVCYSKEPVDWLALDHDNMTLEVPPENADRTITTLGDKNAVVLQFESLPLQARHQYFADHGASWDYDAYHPHITLTYEAPVGLDLSTVEPYSGRIVLGPEVFAEVEEDWADAVKEHIQGQIEIDYIQISKDLDNLEAKFRTALREALVQSRDAVLSKVRRGKGTLPKDFTLPYIKDIQGVIRDALQRAMDRGGADAGKEIKGVAKTKKFVDEGDGVWRTIRGRHVFIREGESLDSALARSLGSSNHSTSLKDVENEIAGEKIEHGVWISKEGVIVHRDTGVEGSVAAISRESADKVVGGVFTHNHPHAMSFSSFDALMFAQTPVAEMRAVTIDKVYRIVKTDQWEMPKSGSKVMTQALRVRDYYLKVYDKIKVQSGVVIAQDKAIAATADRFGWKYSVEDRNVHSHSIGEWVERHTYATPTFTPTQALQWLREKAFWVADVLTGGLTEDIRLAIINGLRDGTATDEIVTNIAYLYVPYLGDPTKVKGGELPTAARLETVVRTNITEAYNQGRLATFVRPDMMPFLDGIEYSAILDSRTTPVCRYLDSKIFHPEDIQITGLVPPNHFGCRSLVIPRVVGDLSKPPDYKVDPSVYITDEQILHAQSLADAKFLEQEDYLTTGDVHVPGPISGAVVEPFQVCSDCSGSTVPTCKKNGACLLEGQKKALAQDEEGPGVWRTVRGRRVFIREGETPAQAVKRSIAVKTSRALASYVPIDKAKRDAAERFEATVAKAIGGKSLGDHEPFDVIKGRHAVEVKAIMPGAKNPKCTMHKESLARKANFLRDEKMTGHTVVVDARGARPIYYYHVGVGSFRLSGMQTVTTTELKGLIK